MILPTGGSVNVSLKEWSAQKKTWNESSTISSVSTQHIIGGFLPNAQVQIFRDGASYTIIKSNRTGYIDWTYSGGYSEHEFSVYTVDSVTPSLVGQWTNTVSMVGAIILISLAVQVVSMVRGKGKIEEITGSVQSDRVHINPDPGRDNTL